MPTPQTSTESEPVLYLTGRLPDDGRFTTPGRIASNGDRGDGLAACRNLADKGPEEPGVPVPPRTFRAGLEEEKRPVFPLLLLLPLLLPPLPPPPLAPPVFPS